MNLKVSPTYEDLSDPYHKVNSAEELYESSVVNHKIVKNLAFLALGVAGMGATTAASMLLGTSVANIVPLIVGSVGIGGVSSVMALTTASFMGDSVVHAESEVKKAYAAITQEQKGELLNNRKNFCSTIANLREKHLKNDSCSEKKLTQ